MFTPVLLLPFLIVLVKSYPFPNDIEFFCSIYTFCYKRQNTFLGQTTNYVNMKIPLSGAHPSSPASEKIWRHVGSFCPWSLSRRRLPVTSAGDLFWWRSKTIFSNPFHISWENFGLWTISMIFLNCFISRWRSWWESPGVKGFLDGNGRVRTTLQIGVIICWTCFS